MTFEVAHTEALRMNHAHPRVRSLGSYWCGRCIDVPWPCSFLSGRTPSDAERHFQATVIEEITEHPDDDGSAA